MCPEGMSYEAHQWHLVDDIIKINYHRESILKPSTTIFVDEYISCFYVIGG